MSVRWCLPLILAASACSGGGGSGGNGLGGTEVEPNDDISIATDLGGAGTHEVSGHACSGDEVGIEIRCYGAFDPVPYSGTITVP